MSSDYGVYDAIRGKTIGLSVYCFMMITLKSPPILVRILMIRVSTDLHFLLHFVQDQNFLLLRNVLVERSRSKVTQGSTKF